MPFGYLPVVAVVILIHWAYLVTGLPTDCWNYNLSSPCGPTGWHLLTTNRSAVNLDCVFGATQSPLQLTPTSVNYLNSEAGCQEDRRIKRLPWIPFGSNWLAEEMTSFVGVRELYRDRVTFQFTPTDAVVRQFVVEGKGSNSILTSASASTEGEQRLLSLHSIRLFSPSEHTFKGAPYDVELQLYFVFQDDMTRVPTLDTRPAVMSANSTLGGNGITEEEDYRATVKSWMKDLSGVSFAISLFGQSSGTSSGSGSRHNVIDSLFPSNRTRLLRRTAEGSEQGWEAVIAPAGRRTTEACVGSSSGYCSKHVSVLNWTAQGPLRLQDLLPPDTGVVMYEGGLSIPPCRGGVTRMLLEQPFTLSVDQVKRLRSEVLQLPDGPLAQSFRRPVKTTNVDGLLTDPTREGRLQSACLVREPSVRLLSERQAATVGDDWNRMMVSFGILRSRQTAALPADRTMPITALVLASVLGTLGGVYVTVRLVFWIRQRFRSPAVDGGGRSYQGRVGGGGSAGTSVSFSYRRSAKADGPDWDSSWVSDDSM
jgi:carbonic anhydrase